MAIHNIYEKHIPDRALAIIANLQHEEVRDVMEAYQENKPLHLQYRYTVVSATATGSATEFTTEHFGEPTPSKSYANSRCIEHFLRTESKIAIANGRPKYVWLTTRPGIKNPQFAYLHAVRYHEVGLGFDEDSCLSLYVAKIVGGERQSKVIYVKRSQMQTESVQGGAGG